MRRFNDAEVAEILKRATTTQEDVRQLPASREGMTLAELQSIGSEVGIPANLIAAAASSLGQGGETTTRSVFGLPLRVERIVDLPRQLSDTEWERVVVQLREIFDARGTMKAEGSLRQWTNGNLQALLEPTAGGQRIRLRTYKGNALPLIGLGSALTLGATMGIAVQAITGVIHDLSLLGFFATVGTTGLATLASTVLRLPGWAQRRSEQMDELAARVGTMDEPTEARSIAESSQP